jgi:hypothetical protein
LAFRTFIESSHVTEHSSKGRASGSENARPTGRRTGHGAETALEELQRRTPGKRGSAPPIQAEGKKQHKNSHNGPGSA